MVQVCSGEFARRWTDQELEAEILKDANDSLSKLMAEFPSDKFQAAQEIAVRYVATYAKKQRENGAH
ncbi:hypothetical protein [Scleromatobacter humisilvae]|uniref:Uncharacterized protein n=1 Tax=Scleromatobacter humisilvae TaxID=2897159 RepID=A0A9X2C3F9_9BURK|nr:hypothetical protein [Scleromatobacter humisilvae]MCK9687425.1 hypothetical protein [Scleromatobacter humisilvae]